MNSLDRPMKLMVNLLRQGRYADEVMGLLKQEQTAKHAKVGRNDICRAANEREIFIITHPRLLKIALHSSRAIGGSSVTALQRHVSASPHASYVTISSRPACLFFTSGMLEPMGATVG